MPRWISNQFHDIVEMLQKLPMDARAQDRRNSDGMVVLRSVVGTMVDNAFMAKDVVARGLVESEFKLALWLADAPIIAIGGGDAITHTRAVFGLAPLPPQVRPWM